jgi:Predicted metal-dependent hydrolase of the TIM-barrel fold
MIIDAHCHVWPDHIAPKVLAGRPAGLDAAHDGTLDGLRRTMDAAGVDMAMCLGVANVARTVERTNEFIGSIDRTRFIPFGTVHPDLSIARNLASLEHNGIGGVKLHPLFQRLSLADPLVLDLLRALAEAGVIVITHAGAGGDEAAPKGASRVTCAASWTPSPICGSSPATTADTIALTLPRS